MARPVALEGLDLVRSVASGGFDRGTVSRVEKGAGGRACRVGQGGKGVAGHVALVWTVPVRLVAVGGLGRARQGMSQRVVRVRKGSTWYVAAGGSGSSGHVT